MSHLPLANDPSLMACVVLMAKMVVTNGHLSPALREQVNRLKACAVSRTFQIRMVAPLATETVDRLVSESVCAEALLGFFVMGALLDPDVFADAVADLEERYVGRGPLGSSPLLRQAELSVAMDFAAALVPGLTPAHLEVVVNHWGRATRS